MLVLHRKPNAGDKSILCIGDHVTVTVVAIRGEMVDLVVCGPPGVTVTAKSPVPSRRKPRPENKTAAA